MMVPPVSRVFAAVVACGCAIAALSMTAQERTSPRIARGSSGGNWPLHSVDVYNTRYSPLKQIDASNVHRLESKWSYRFDTADSTAQVTPLVVDGIMYVHAGSRLIALDAATGSLHWTRDATETRLARSG